MMITARREKHRTASIPLRDLEAQHAMIKREGPFEIGHLQMNMADADVGMDDRSIVHVEEIRMSPPKVDTSIIFKADQHV